MKARSALLCLCLCLPGAAPALGAASAEQVFRKAAPAVVTIVVRDETGARSAGGSGVAVGRNEVVTNCHIVVEGETIAVQDSAGTHAAIWTLRDPAHDLCLLQVEGLAATAAQSADTAALAPGSPVYAIGNPLSMGLAVTEGKLAAVPPAQGGLRGLISTAAVAPGSSGGGLFDAEGRLIGITTLMYGSGQGYSYALAAEGIAELKRSGKPVVARAPFEAEPEWRDRFAELQAKKAVRDMELEARRYLTLHPDADFGLAQLAFALMQSATPGAADEPIERALRANPNNLRAEVARMERMQQKNGPAAAEQAVRAQLAKRPDYAPFQILLGDTLVAQGRFAEALAPYQRALRHGPVDASNRTRLGYVQMQLNQFDDAARTLRIALKLDPSQDNAKTYLALVLAKLGKWQEAGSSMGELKGDLPALHGALELLGRNALVAGRYIEAEQAFRKALTLNPRSTAALHGLAETYLKTARNAEAETHIRQALALAPTDGGLLVTQGELLLRQGNAEAAEASIQRGLDSGVENAGYALRLLAAARDARRDHAGAVEALDKALKYGPPNKEDLKALGNALTRAAKYERAGVVLNQALALAPADPDTLSALAAMKGLQGDNAVALDYANRALAIDASHPKALSNKGYALLRQNRLTEAVQALELAARLVPDDVNVLINLGNAHMRAGQIGRAITVLDAAVKRAPEAVDGRALYLQSLALSGQRARARTESEIWLKQKPDLPQALFVHVALSLSDGRRDQALLSYRKLQALDPALARQLHERSHRPGTPQSMQLPD